MKSVYLNKKPFNPYIRLREKEYNNIYVVGDVHGCYKTLVNLVEQLDLGPKDVLIMVGDYINKGEQGKEVLDWILRQIVAGKKIIPLRGNHEQMLIDKILYKIDDVLLDKKNGIADKKGNLLPKYAELFNKLPYFVELDKYFVVHAGINFTSRNPLQDFESMLHMRHHYVDTRGFLDKTVVHGHTAHSLSEIKYKIKTYSHLIPVDGGCVYPFKKGMGHLIAYELKSRKLFVQENLEMATLEV